MKKVKNAILWDLDGTIVDTKACHRIAFQLAMQRHGYQLDPDLFDKHFGRNNLSILVELLGFKPEHELLMKIFDEKEQYFRQLAPGQITLVPGVTTWLVEAHGLDYAQAIASSAPIESITGILDIFNLGGYFTALASGHDLPAKPEPDVFFRAAKALQVAPEQCLVIEDSVAGVAGAKNAGMRCIAVATNRKRVDLSQADVVIDDFTVPLNEVLQGIGLD